jgi:hypothetical protein
MSKRGLHVNAGVKNIPPKMKALGLQMKKYGGAYQCKKG